MEALFGHDKEPFLSVDADSVEVYTQEETTSQDIQPKAETGIKRKPEEAFPQSPTEELQALIAQANKRKNETVIGENDKVLTVEGEPQSTSSPRKTSQDHIIMNQSLINNPRYSEPPSPMSQVVTLDESTGAMQKMRTKTGKEDDGQHRDEDNCGCHQCINPLTHQGFKLLAREPNVFCH